MGGRHFHYGDGHGGCGFSLRYLPGSVLPLVVHFLSGSRTLTALSMKRACLSLRCALEIMRLGVAGCVMQATNALVLVAATSTLRSVGSDVYIGILTILSSVRDVVVVPIHGLTGAAQAVIGFNFGAGKLKRVLTGGAFSPP